MAATPKSKKPKSKKRARGLFPHLPLSKALVLPEAIYKLGYGKPIRRLRVFSELNKSPSSGTSGTLITAANSGYNLIEGGHKSETWSLTEFGKAIVTSDNEASKREAIYDSLFYNDIFTSLISHFSDDPLPIDDVVHDYLQNDHKLSELDAKLCWEIIKSNIYTFGLVKEYSGKDHIISRETALEELEIPSDQMINSSDDDVSPPIEEQPEAEPGATKSPDTLHQIAPQIHFNIQVVIPENASPEDYDNIFKSIATHLLGRGE